jgi:hypothetical protein
MQKGSAYDRLPAPARAAVRVDRRRWRDLCGVLQLRRRIARRGEGRITMGRTLKRVPMIFAWPMHEVWYGYLNPFSPNKCGACNQSGYNDATRKIAEDFYSGSCWGNAITQDEVQALVDKNRLKDVTHTWTPNEGWQRRADQYVPLASDVNAWNRCTMGHDSVNRMILLETRAKRLGVYGQCDFCNGEGELFQNDEHRRIYDDWRPIEPPCGDGFQLWETCSEGSPISPVFDSAESLADWCANNASVFGDEKTTRDKWLQMFLGQIDIELGSLMIARPGYIGAIVNDPEKVAP